MSSWLTPLRQVLDKARAPITWHFRDDDAGWDDAQLWALLDLFDRHGAALDVAVIPGALLPTTARELRARRRGMVLGMHQHGYAHVNHELQGRKCEFGASRSHAQQLADLRAGQALLRDLLEDSDPVFTPPWNRCTQATIDCLRELGFHALSRDAGADPVETHALAELAVNVDWQRHADEVNALGIALARSARTGRAAVMLHHAPMQAADRAALDELLGLISTSSNCRPTLMRTAIARGRIQAQCVG